MPPVTLAMGRLHTLQLLHGAGGNHDWSSLLSATASSSSGSRAAAQHAHQACTSSVEASGADFLIGPAKSRHRVLAAFFNTAGPLQPAYGWGDDENSSSCFDCACSQVYDVHRKRPPTRVVLPNVPHHAFIGHQKNLGVSWKRLIFLWILGAGLGYGVMLGVKAVVYEDKSASFKAEGGKSLTLDDEEEEEETEPESSEEDDEED
mmetsp:Transcript_30510/g.67167  ORF Transcript_30510/g.67167 Transcript_30510/m.67167 type:complete len:205 (-) Transcript_30510:9-623(-)